MSLALQFAHPIVITQHFFLILVKSKMDFYVSYIWMLRVQHGRCGDAGAADAADDGQVFHGPIKFHRTARVSDGTAFARRVISVLWIRVCSCTQTETQTDTKVCRSSWSRPGADRLGCYSVMSCSAFLVCNISRLAACSCFCRYELQCMLRAFLLL